MVCDTLPVWGIWCDVTIFHTTDQITLLSTALAKPHTSYFTHTGLYEEETITWWHFSWSLKQCRAIVTQNGCLWWDRLTSTSTSDSKQWEPGQVAHIISVTNKLLQICHLIIRERNTPKAQTSTKKVISTHIVTCVHQFLSCIGQNQRDKPISNLGEVIDMV